MKSPPPRTYHQFFVIAGRAGEAPPADAPFLPDEVAGRAWYWAGACADMDGDAADSACPGQAWNDRAESRLTLVEISSLRPLVISHHSEE